MRRIPLLFLLAALSAIDVTPQSGRRINTPASTTPAAPVQPPLTPEPPVRSSAPRPLTELMMLPESVRERPIKAIGDDSFRLADFEGKVVVINLWASWCGPCRMVAPELVKVAARSEGKFLVVKVNTDALSDLGQRFTIRSIPTMAVYSGGREVKRTTGARPAADIEAFIAQAMPMRPVA